MNKELDERLVRDFPFLYVDRHAPMSRTCLCWGFDVGDGWYKITKKLSQKLDKMIAKLAWLHPEYVLNGTLPRASQVKEKFGTLRFYMDSSTEEMEDLIEEAQLESARTCEVCGQPGKTHSIRGWLSTVCPKHKKEYEKERP